LLNQSECLFVIELSTVRDCYLLPAMFTVVFDYSRSLRSCSLKFWDEADEVKDLKSGMQIDFFSKF